jgi:hypothetical protein
VGQPDPIFPLVLALAPAHGLPSDPNIDDATAPTQKSIRKRFRIFACVPVRRRMLLDCFGASASTGKIGSLP